MRLIAKLQVPITGIQIRHLQTVGAKLLFRSAYAGVVGFDMEDVSPLNQFDFILGWRPSQKGQVLLHSALQAVDVLALHEGGLTGAGIWVSVIDSGIITSDPALGSVVVARMDFTGEGAYDYALHGTLVAKIINAIASDASLLNAKAVDRYGDVDEIAVFQALEWSLDNGADIANLSLGFQRECHGDCWLCQFVDTLVEQGMTVVAAAGNWGPSDGTISCPGNAARAVTVGATEAGAITPYSSRGRADQEKPDVVAPGTIEVGRFHLSGTSIAAPMVSGILASLYGPYERQKVLGSLSTGCADLGFSRNQQGYGQIDAHKILEVL
ncbi:serine protease AprX [Candidatus Hakubella thermalkaliphila]|uniref:Serine protease AprX n=1 Tax=Candidatus Hakubella thermalkaliphila TaxID=2754717 RepID=A0A6V8PHK1_9ACTN|nr:serine protease AprX [Candidatus Hakubella thermalkaliphila]